MKEHPMLFSGPMVRAIAEGRKTQTRRVIRWPVLGRSDGRKRRVFAERYAEHEASDLARAARWQPGDRIWVKETFRRSGITLPDGIEYRADNSLRYFVTREAAVVTTLLDRLRRDGRWRPSIFMPRWASRYSMEVLTVRAERLLEIGEADAVAEGIPFGGRLGKSKLAFASAWDTINGKRAPWASNPWIWAIEFRALQS